VCGVCFQRERMVVKPQQWAESAVSVPGSDVFSGGAMDSPHAYAAANEGVFIGPDTEPGELLGRRRLRKHYGPLRGLPLRCQRDSRRLSKHVRVAGASG